MSPHTMKPGKGGGRKSRARRDPQQEARAAHRNLDTAAPNPSVAHKIRRTSFFHYSSGGPR
jgi:hypothetical protein